MALAMAAFSVCKVILPSPSTSCPHLNLSFIRANGLSSSSPFFLPRTSSYGGSHIQKPSSASVVTLCSSEEISVASSSSSAQKEEEGGGGRNSWVPVIPLTALPKGERRLVRQDGEDVLLLWYKNEIIAIENSSPAEGAYTEGFINAKLTQDGCIICPSTDSLFDLKTGEIKEWFPSNPVLRILTPPLRNMMIYPVKVDSEFIYINTQISKSGESAEIIFRGQVQAGRSVSSVEVDEVRMVVDDEMVSFGFTTDNEITNGRSAMVGFTFLLIFELLTGKGFLKGTGFLDFLYQYLIDFPILKY